MQGKCKKKVFFRIFLTKNLHISRKSSNFAADLENVCRRKTKYPSPTHSWHMQKYALSKKYDRREGYTQDGDFN